VIKKYKNLRETTYLGTLARYVISRLKSSYFNFSGCVAEGKVSMGPPLLSRPPIIYIIWLKRTVELLYIQFKA